MRKEIRRVDPHNGMSAKEMEARRMRAAKMLKSGRRQVDVAFAMGVSRETVSRWNKYLATGKSLKATRKRSARKPKAAGRIPHIEIPHLSEYAIRRFWSHIEVLDPLDCWPWISSHALSDGRGFFKCKSNDGVWRNVLASRVACHLGNGPFDSELDVLHGCDNPPCCNPAHLQPGTSMQNSNDCVSKGRIAVGERSSSGKLTDENVIEIRRRYHSKEYTSLRVFAKEYGVEHATLRLAAIGKSWTHIPMPPYDEASQ